MADHPTAEQLYRARRGPRTSEAERWLAHAVACAACSEELFRQEAFDAPPPVRPDRLAAAWKDFGPREPLAPVLPISKAIPILLARRPARRPAVQRWALAAVLAAAVAGLGLWSQRGAPRVRSSFGGAAAASWQPAGLLDAPPTEILFPSPAGAPRRATVFDVSRVYSWTSPPAAGGRIAFPEAERRKLRPGVTYFWTLIDDPHASPRSFRLR